MKCSSPLIWSFLFAATVSLPQVLALPLQQVIIDKSDIPVYYKEVPCNHTAHDVKIAEYRNSTSQIKNGTVGALNRFVKHPAAPWATAVTSLGLNGLQAYYNHKNYKLKIEAENALKALEKRGYLHDDTNDNDDGGVRLHNRRRLPSQSRSSSPKSSTFGASSKEVPLRKESKEKIVSVVDEAIANAVDKFRRTSEEMSPLFKRRSSDAIKTFEERHQKKKGPDDRGYQQIYDEDAYQKAWSPLNRE